MTKDTRPKTQPTEPSQQSAEAIEIAEDYACRWHPTLTLPEINKQWRYIILEHAEAIDRETGVGELSGLVKKWNAQYEAYESTYLDNNPTENLQLKSQLRTLELCTTELEQAIAKREGE